MTAGYDGMSSDSGGEPAQQQPCRTWRTKRTGVAVASAALLLAGGAVVSAKALGYGQARLRAGDAMGAFAKGMVPVGEPLSMAYPITNPTPFKELAKSIASARLAFKLRSPENSVIVSEFAPYYNYEGDLKVTGT